MKLRNGFVSNSSSSSFCIIGVHTDEDTYYNLQEKYSDAIDAKNYMKICLYVLIINYIVCWFVSIYTGREKEKIREYRVQVTEVKPDNLGTLGNNLN